MKNLKNLKHEHIFVGLLIIIIIVGVLFVLFKDYSATKPNDSGNSTPQDLNANHLNIEDSSIVKFLDNNFNLKDGWKVLETFSSKNCGVQKDKECTVYKVGKDKNSYYVSDRYEYVIDNPYLTEFDFLKVNTSTGQQLLNSEKFQRFDDSGKAISNGLYQAYGCFGPGVCVSSGMFATDELENQKNVDNFVDFVSKNF